jgi:serine protease DegQ
MSRQLSRARLGLAALCASGLLLTACTGSTGSAAGGGTQGGQAAATTGAQVAPPAAATGGLEAVPGVVAKLQPSAVTILVDGGNGSGVVYKPDGLIVTNEHVVRGQTSVEVAFADGRRVAGRVRAVDPITDLALVQAERRNLTPARFQTQLPAVGSLSVVIGSPLGFQNSVTAGIVSGVHREIPGSAREGQSLVDLLQTDAPISPGNSGGAVANARAEVIGIALAYIPPTAGAVALGFAIPAATVVDIIGQLERDGRAEHAYAGLVPAAITPEIARQLGLPSTEGVVVLNVVPGGPAQRAGLRPGDVITAVDGEATPTPEDFLAALRPHRPGDTLTLTVRSPGGDERQVRLTVIDRPVAG